MSFILQPWHLVLLILAGWVNREQQEVIDYLLTENAVLKEKLGKKRILLSDDQRRRLAVKGQVLGRKKLLTMDRDPKFTARFRGLLRGEGIKSLRLPSRSPNLNAYIERFFGSLKSEGLDQLILFGEQSLRNAVREYLFHYHTKRNHQGVGNQMIVPLERPSDTEAPARTLEFSRSHARRSSSSGRAIVAPFQSWHLRGFSFVFLASITMYEGRPRTSLNIRPRYSPIIPSSNDWLPVQNVIAAITSIVPPFVGEWTPLTYHNVTRATVARAKQPVTQNATRSGLNENETKASAAKPIIRRVGQWPWPASRGCRSK